MNEDQSQTTLETKLEALQCHFTWDINPSRDTLFRFREKLEDIGAEEGNCWLGHIYNLQGYIHHKLGFNEEAKSFFSRAAEAFKQRNTASDNEKCLMVNYANQAWLHHHLGEEAESQSYLSKIDALINKYPPPSQDQLYPEVYAEKAWTLMKFSLSLYPHSSFVKKIDLANRYAKSNSDQAEAEQIYQELLESDLEPADRQMLYNKYAHFLFYNINDSKTSIEYHMKAAEIPEKTFFRENSIKILKKVKDPHSSLVKKIDLANRSAKSNEGLAEAEQIYQELLDSDLDDLEPADRQMLYNQYAKFMFFNKNDSKASIEYHMKAAEIPGQSFFKEKSIQFLKKIKDCRSSFLEKIGLAKKSAKSKEGLAEAKQIYQELLESDLEPADRQMLYNQYANFLFFTKNDSKTSIEYHMKAAEIPEKSFFRENSIKKLEKIKDLNRSPMCRDIEEFLQKLQL